MGPDTHGNQRENRHPKCYRPKKSHGKINRSFFSAIACLVHRFINTMIFVRRCIPGCGVARRSSRINGTPSSRLASRAPRRPRYKTVLMNRCTYPPNFPADPNLPLSAPPRRGGYGVEGVSPRHGNISRGPVKSPGDPSYRPQTTAGTEDANLVTKVSIKVGRDRNIPLSTEVEAA